MGAHRLSGQHQQVTSVTPSTSGTGTPQSMLPVMRKGTSALPLREAHAAVGEHRVGVVALLPAGEGDGKAALVALGLQHGVLGQLVLDGVEGLAELVLNIELCRQQPLLHGLGDHGANLRVLGELGGVGLHKVEVGRQVKVEVVDRAQLGYLAGELALGRDELLGLKLVTQVALIGIRLLGLAAPDGAAADHRRPLRNVPALAS